jgi:hypothetical protein
VVASVPYDSALRSLASQGKLDTYETDKLDYLARAILELR